MAQMRVVIQSNRKDADDVISGLNEQAQRVRQTDGCLQFEYFRSTDIAEDLLLLGLWESVEAFDAFWQEHPDSAFALEEPRLLQAPYHYGSPVLPRRHGQNGIDSHRRRRAGRNPTLAVVHGRSDHQPGHLGPGEPRPQVPLHQRHAAGARLHSVRAVPQRRVPGPHREHGVVDRSGYL